MNNILVKSKKVDFCQNQVGAYFWRGVNQSVNHTANPTDILLMT